MGTGSAAITPNASRPIGIVIADDHGVVRLGLRVTITGEPDMRLLGEAETGREAIDLVGAVQPDVALLDIKMPDMDGISAAMEIRGKYPQVAVLILTSYSDDARLYNALRAGVKGYLLKEMSGDALVATIRNVARGDVQLHPAIMQRLMERMAPPEDPLTQLTQREQDVLRLMASGLSNKEISAALSLTELTVKGYVRSVLSKLHVSDRTQAALLAVRYGLVSPDDLLDVRG